MVGGAPLVAALTLANIGSVPAVRNGVVDHAAVDHASLIDPEEIFDALAGVAFKAIGELDRVAAYHATQGALRPPVDGLALTDRSSGADIAIGILICCTIFPTQVLIAVPKKSHSTVARFSRWASGFFCVCI